MAQSRDEVTIVVHDGAAHMDEVTALAICTLWLDARGYDWEIIRSRDPHIIANANIVFDVGGIYDPGARRFDHHQRDFDMVRDNDIPYASAGLAWKHYGLDLCDGDATIAERIDSELIQSIDAPDNGIALMQSIHPTGVTDLGAYKLLNWLQPTWREEEDQGHDAVWRMLELMRLVIPRIIVHIRDEIHGRTLVRAAYDEAVDKRIIILSEPYPWRVELLQFPEPLFVVYPKPNGWYVSGVYADATGFVMRAKLPESWCGLDQSELRTVSRIPTIVFCHKNGFLGQAETVEDAVLMAVTALIEHEANNSVPVQTHAPAV